MCVCAGLSIKWYHKNWLLVTAVQNAYVPYALVCKSNSIRKRERVRVLINHYVWLNYRKRNNKHTTKERWRNSKDINNETSFYDKFSHISVIFNAFNNSRLIINRLCESTWHLLFLLQTIQVVEDVCMLRNGQKNCSAYYYAALSLE